MNNSFQLNNLIHIIPKESYEIFGSQLKNKVLGKLSLHAFKDKLLCDYIKILGGELFYETITSLLVLLNDQKIGIGGLDVPEIPLFDHNENAVLGAAVVMSIFNNIGTPNIDTINTLPFAVHTASHSNEEQLDSKGLEKFTPDMKLGFHNDGLLSDEKIEIPYHVMVYNLFIGYKEPGNFIWIPTKLWDEAEQYQQIAENDNITVKIKLSPNYHQDKNGNLVNTIANFIEVPVSSVNSSGERQFFLNGQVLLEDNTQKQVDFVQSMRDSLERNPTKISIPQQSRRAVFIKNTSGFHARNIFEQPIEGIDLTRVYLRAVDYNSEQYFSIA